MSSGIDLSQFFATFYDEADELLADMERLLLDLDVSDPDSDQLHGIFRAAHSIKGGAGTFGCFEHLAQTTHLLENLLDFLRRGEMVLRKDMVDLFLDTKDVLVGQVSAYRESRPPDMADYDRICAQLRELALEQNAAVSAASPVTESVSVPVRGPAPGVEMAVPDGPPWPLHIRVENIKSGDIQALMAEMTLLGDVLYQDSTDSALSAWLQTDCSIGDIQAVCCFIVNADQVKIEHAPLPAAAGKGLSGQRLTATDTIVPAGAPSLDTAEAAGEIPQARKAGRPPPSANADHAVKPEAGRKENGTIRVGVEKVDQIINLVGELVITQSMLVQTVSTLDPVLHDRLMNGIEQLERNARDMQEAVMSIRMMPMDYVFSRFPRLVREGASKLGKRIKLVTNGQATELDKSLIERIVDPLTHLVRNSLDHGIELPETRVQHGKNPEGNLTLSAQHNGGQIVIEVSDDGSGLNRDRILKKAFGLGMAISENAPDDEVWQLVFAPGFSTADQVTDISGRGVGMDVVRRNIQGMGGHIHLSSYEGKGTTTRIVLPLTLAILDGMSVRVGQETFILPLSHVTESMQPTQEQIHNVSDSDRVLFVRGEYLPLVALHSVFSVDGAQTEITRSIAVIVQAQDLRFALLVDHLIGQHQVVVKNLESNYRKIPGISAATILGDGSVALIVDVFALMRMTHGNASAMTHRIPGENHA